MPPTTLPSRYRDPQLIAHGGMGDVYRATDAELGREVAVKVLAERYAQDHELQLRFRREALAAARLSGNPHIVTIFDVAEHSGRPLIVMELVPGGSLEQRVAGRAPCPPGQVLDWLADAAQALDAAHAAGIVHRDVKPGNLLIGSDGRVKVADFGIASAVGLDSFTQTGTILGTAGYLSPEQARGERATAASDRYALAVVAWELLVGRRPFESETPTAEAAAHAHTPAPPISHANGSLPGAFDAIFARALAKDPARRYPTAAEFVGDLRRALHQDADDTWIERVPHVTPAQPRRHSRRLWLPLVVALLAAAGIAAAVLASRDGHDAASGTTPKPQSRTVVRTVTEPGTTVQQTVTAAAPPTTEATTTAPAAPNGTNGADLNNEGYARMQAGDYAGALPLLQRAVEELDGTGSVDEAYADYNLAYTRFALGDCTDVLALLDASERIQGHRSAITRLRHDARRTC